MAKRHRGQLCESENRAPPAPYVAIRETRSLAADGFDMELIARDALLRMPPRGYRRLTSLDQNTMEPANGVRRKCGIQVKCLADTDQSLRLVNHLNH